MNKKGKLKESIFYFMRLTVLQIVLITMFAGNLLAKEAGGQDILEKKISITAVNQHLKNIFKKLRLLQRQNLLIPTVSYF